MGNVRFKNYSKQKIGAEDKHMRLGYIQKWHLFCNDCFVRNISVLLNLFVYSVNFSILEIMLSYTQVLSPYVKGNYMQDIV